jgi:hypothetical protein
LRKTFVADTSWGLVAAGAAFGASSMLRGSVGGVTGAVAPVEGVAKDRRRRAGARGRLPPSLFYVFGAGFSVFLFDFLAGTGYDGSGGLYGYTLRRESE